MRDQHKTDNQVSICPTEVRALGKVKQGKGFKEMLTCLGMIKGRERKGQKEVRSGPCRRLEEMGTASGMAGTSSVSWEATAGLVSSRTRKAVSAMEGSE